MTARAHARLLAALSCAAVLLFVAAARPNPTLAHQPPRTLETALRSHIATLVRIGPRNAEHPEGYRSAARYITSVLTKGAVMFRTIALRSAPASPPVIEARFGGAPATLVLCAHYDTAGDSPGGADNASGVAVLLEAARLATRDGAAPGLRIVFFPNEEAPLFMTESCGSRQYADDLAANGATAGRVVSVDTLADSLFVGSRSPSAPLARQLAETLPPTVSASPVITDAGGFWIDRSDHAAFLRHGWQGVLLTAQSSPMNTTLHTPADTADDMAYDALGTIVRALLRFARATQADSAAIADEKTEGRT